MKVRVGADDLRLVLQHDTALDLCGLKIITLVPASLFPLKGTYQTITNTFPTGSVLCVSGAQRQQKIMICFKMEMLIQLAAQSAHPELQTHQMSLALETQRCHRQHPRMEQTIAYADRWSERNCHRPH